MADRKDEQDVLMIENGPLVSVVIPVYNGERYLAEALESVLAQTYRHIEILVIDDGSTDRSAAIANQYDPAVRYFFQTNGGSSAARNAGVGLARGDYIAFLDSDDVWKENKLMVQMTVFQGSQEVDMVFAHVQQFISPDLDDRRKSSIYCPAEKMPGYVVGTMLIKRESFVRAGLFQTNWRVGEFVDWYMRAKETGMKGVMLPEVVLRRRLHADNMGVQDRVSRTDYARILKAALDRRRASGRIRDVH